jgi:pimeloyl-ACP methyl ester carboxylesterase
MRTIPWQAREPTDRMRTAMTALVFVHGSGHTHESFDAQTAAFPGADAVSLPGHPEGRPLESVGDCAAWLVKYLRWKGADQAIIGGNSLGGAIAIEAALRYPERVAGLILLGTGARLRVAPHIFEMIDTQWPECIDALADLSLGTQASADLRTRLKEWHLTVGRDSTRQDYRLCNDFDAIDRVASIKTRTLVVVGSEDRMTPQKYSQFLHEKIAGSEFVLVEGAGHLAHAEKPEAVNHAIRAAFAEVLA